MARSAILLRHCTDVCIEGITFVGSTRVAKIVYRRGTANLKRVLALGGAKNHLIVMPDAEPEMTSSNVVASMSGCAGQRCMAASVMMAVGATDHIVLPVSHLGMLLSARVARETGTFLTQGRFALR